MFQRELRALGLCIPKYPVALIIDIARLHICVSVIFLSGAETFLSRASVVTSERAQRASEVFSI